MRIRRTDPQLPHAWSFYTPTLKWYYSLSWTIYGEMKVANGPHFPQNCAWLVVHAKMWMWGKWGPIFQPIREVFGDNFWTNSRKKLYKKKYCARNENLSSKICAPIFSISLCPTFFANINADDLGPRPIFTPHWWRPPIPPNDYIQINMANIITT